MGKGIPSNVDIVKAMDQLLKSPRVAFSPEAVRRVRDEVVAMRALKSQVEKTMRELGEANASLSEHVESLRMEIANLNVLCIAKDAQIVSMQNILESKTQEFKALAAELDAMVDAAALEVVAKQMSSMAGLDELAIGALGEEANDMLNRLSSRESRGA